MPKNTSSKPQVLTPELLWQIQRLGSPSLSPDGAQAVATLTSFDAAANTGSTSLWLLSTLGGAPRQLTAAGDKDAQPAWSPKGDAIAFLAKRTQEAKSDEAAQLYVIAPDGGEARRVTALAGGVSAFKWFPDGKRILASTWLYPKLKLDEQAEAFADHKARKDTAYATEEAQYRYWDHNIPEDRVVHLLVIDVESGKARDLFAGSRYELARTEHDATHFDISPDGATVAFVFDPEERKLGSNCTHIVELAVPKRFGKGTEADAKTVVDAKGWDHSAPRYSADGTQLAFLRAHIGKHHTLQNQIAVLNRKTAKLRAVLADWDRTPQAPLHWIAGDALAFKAEDFGQTHVWRAALADKSPTLWAKGGTVQALDVRAGQVLWMADAMDHPARLYTAPQADALQPSRIEHFNDKLLAKVPMGAWESVLYKGANVAPQLDAQGNTAQMWVVYPPGFNRKKKYPLMHAIHGGPHTASGDTFHYRWNNQVFAAQGYVVLCVNYHGSTSFGHAFIDSITHQWGKLELEDVEAATDWALKKPFIDKKRVYATGGSYGGYMVAWMNGHLPKNRYNAYVCHAGCWDWVGMYADDAWHWHRQELGADYFADMQKIHAQSPHAHAEKLTTPTLVIHGVLDYRVPDAQGLAYYNTLKAQNIPARLVWYPDENHWILKPANALRWWKEFFGWLARF